MTSIKRRLLAAVLIVAATAGTASGQGYRAFQSEWARVTRDATFHLGPFQAFLAFDVRRIAYGDNIYFEDRPVRDFTAGLAPSLTLYLPFRRRAIFYVRESPEYTFYWREAGMRELTNGYGGGAKILFFNRFALSGDFERRNRIQTVSMELGRPARYTGTSSTASLFYETARGTSIGFSGSIQKISYSDIASPEGEINLSSVLDRTERGGAMEVYYPIRNDSSIFIRVGATEYRFGRTATDRDATSYQAVSGLRFPILGRISGTISAGYKKFDPRTAGQASFSGWIADSQVEFRTGRFALRAGLGRDIGFSYLEDAFFYVSDAFSVGGSFYPVRFFRLDYGYVQGFLSYPPAGGAAVVPAGAARKDKQWSHSAALVFRIFRTFGLGIQAASERWTSNIPGWDRTRTYAGVYLTTRF